jgi:hypothetical protein
MSLSNIKLNVLRFIAVFLLLKYNMIQQKMLLLVVSHRIINNESRYWENIGKS